LHLDGVTVLGSNSEGPVATLGYDGNQVYLGETL
jgi:hypothetical protein